MKKGDKSSDNGQNAYFGHRKVRDFMRNAFQREEINQLNRSKADRNQKIRIQRLQDDFKGYHQQIEGVITQFIETLPAQVKASFRHAMQEYENLKDDFSDVIRFTTSDQPAMKPSDYLSPYLLDLARSAKNAHEARLSDAVNQIRPLHQKLMHKMLLAKFHEAARLTDQLRQETANNQRFQQESERQRSTTHEMTTKMDQDVEILAARFHVLLQAVGLFPQDADEKFIEVANNFDDYRSISEDNRRNSAQTEVSDLLNTHATLRGKQRAIAEGIENLETIKEQRLLQERNRESENQKSIIREMSTKVDQDVTILFERFHEFHARFRALQQSRGSFSEDANNMSIQLGGKFNDYYSTSASHLRNFDQTAVSDLLNAYDSLRGKQQDIAESIGNLTTIEILLKTEEEKRQKQIFGQELWETLERAKPELPGEIDKAFAHLERLHREHERLLRQADSSDKHRDIMEARDRDYIDTFKKLLRYLSPETLDDLEKYGVEFVAKHVKPDAEVWYPQVAKGENDTLLTELPIPYPYGMTGLALRVCDLVLEVLQQKDKRVPSPEIRAEVATRVFLANERLGPHKLARQGYEMAEMYYMDYESGIQQALLDGRINSNMPKDELIRIAHEHACNEYLKSIKPPDGIPELFPTMQPGSYFEESRIWKLNEGQRPVEVGSEEFETLMMTLMERKREGNNFTLTVNILPPDKGNPDTKNKILVQPFYTLEGLRSHHPINAGGKHTVWAGEIDIDYETMTVLRIKDQSGHFRTFIPNKPYRMIEYALDEFQERGFNIDKADIQLTVLVGHREVSYSNYRPLSLEDYQPLSLEEESSPQGTTMEDIDQLRGMASQNPIQFTEWAPQPSSISLPVTPRSVSRAEWRDPPQLTSRARSLTR